MLIREWNKFSLERDRAFWIEFVSNSREGRKPRAGEKRCEEDDGKRNKKKRHQEINTIPLV